MTSDNNRSGELPSEVEKKSRVRAEVTGIVQGVGFRPFVYRLAAKYRLSGWVLNDSNGVVIEVEGKSDHLKAFLDELHAKPPPLARIVDLQTHELSPKGESGFRIVESVARAERAALISPDVATCDDCLRELFDPRDRRYRYPFINCTNCGTRYTIIRDIPYDRPKTTMAKFKMCAACDAEYHDPADRRFHAQPDACWECGPRLSICDAEGKDLEADEPISEAIAMLQQGLTVAVKGLGGFHLAVDAANESAVQRLRRRKRREEKALAIMSKNVRAIRQYAWVSDLEEELLQSFQRPIVLLRKRDPNPIAPSVAPRSRWFGAMLPYTPVHHLLMEGDFVALVMTSGNISEEPICFENDDAVRRLKGIADAFLLHDRDIFMRTDDSVTRIQKSGQVMLRRARGYVPVPVFLKEGGPSVLAVGPELKNTICLLRGREGFLSQHIGDIKNLDTLAYLDKAIKHLQGILEVQPEAIAHDMHPDYLSTRWAQKTPRLRLFAVQHHHAHVASCMAEHGLNEKVIGIAFDGTGYGTDGRIWGGEFLLCELNGFDRVGHFGYVPMPGGDACVENPLRMAVGYLHRAFGREFLKLDIPAMRKLRDSEMKVVLRMLEGEINSPLTSSVGRLFDTISALLEICDFASYEGQPAIELEAAAREDCDESYECSIGVGRPIVVDCCNMLRDVVRDIAGGLPADLVAVKFHNAIANAALAVCHEIARTTDVRKVVLSGGCFQNMLLSDKLESLLGDAGFEVYQHRLVPPNDGGVSLGQAVVARALLCERSEEKA